MPSIQDRLINYINKRCIYGRDRDDVLRAATALGLEVNADHPLADLYRALHLSADDQMLYLSVEHCAWLKTAIERLTSFN